MNDTPENIVVKTESVQNIANSIRSKNNKTDKYKIGEMSGAIDELPTYIPNSMANVYVNGVHNVAQFEKVSVDVPVPSGAIEITQNGRTDVKDYMYADVNVPQPSGSTTITSNGTHDVTQYASAIVNTPSYTPDSAIAISSNGQHNVGIYEFANVNVKAQLKGTIWIADITFNGADDYANLINQYDMTNLDKIYISNYSGTIGTFFLPSTFHGTFVQCSSSLQNNSLKTVLPFDSSNITNMSPIFNNRQLGIINFPELDVTSCTSLGSMLSQQTTYANRTLSDDSFNNIMNMCRKSLQTNNRKLSYVINGLASYNANDQASLTTVLSGLSNYQAFIDSGWTVF